jgi:diguanylate cyclase (GGDEF)-like protein
MAAHPPVPAPRQEIPIGGLGDESSHRGAPLPRALDTRLEAPRPEAHPGEVAFWVRHALVGLIVTLVTVGLVLAHARGLPDDGVRRALTALGLVAIATSLGASLAIPKAVRRNRHLPLFYAWSYATVGFVLLACKIDRGVDSPLTFLLFLPLLFGSLAYAWKAVLALGLVEVLGIAGLASLPGTASTSRLGLLVGSTALATMMATLAAQNHSARQRALEQLTERLEQQALHDGLARCLNWRGFDLALTAELSRAKRYEHPLALLALDIDHLKKINDLSGHAAGDAAIRHVAAAMLGLARTNDVVGRLGGDEFAMLLPETSLEDAASLARRLHEHLRTTPSPPITVSIGLAGLHETGSLKPEDFLRAADSGLYAAKHGGRDRTELSVPA